MSVATLAAVVSRQHIPTILSVLHFEPAQLLLVVTPEMRDSKQDDTLLAALRMAGKHFEPAQVTRIFLPSQVNAFRTIREIESAFETPPDVVNISSGTKPLSGALLAAAVARQSREIIYVDADAPDQFVNQRTGVSCTFRHGIELPTFLAAHRAEMQKGLTPPPEAVEAAMTFVGTGLRSFASYTADTETDPHRLLRPANKLGISEPVRAQLVAKVAALPATDRYEFVKFRWLELFFFGVLQKVQEQLGITDLNTGLELCWNDHPRLTNELDIAFMRSNAFWHVECKSGDWLNRDDDVATRARNETVQTVLCQIAGRNAQFHSIGAQCAAALTHNDANTPDSFQRAAQLGLSLVGRDAIASLFRHYAAGEDQKLAGDLRILFGWTA